MFFQNLLQWMAVDIVFRCNMFEIARTTGAFSLCLSSHLCLLFCGVHTYVFCRHVQCRLFDREINASLLYCILYRVVVRIRSVILSAHCHWEHQHHWTITLGGAMQLPEVQRLLIRRKRPRKLLSLRNLRWCPLCVDHRDKCCVCHHPQSTSTTLVLLWTGCECLCMLLLLSSKWVRECAKLDLKIEILYLRICHRALSTIVGRIDRRTVARKIYHPATLCTKNTANAIVETSEQAEIWLVQARHRSTTR